MQMSRHQMSISITEGLKEQIDVETKRLNLRSSAETVRHILVEYFQKK